MQKVQHLVRKSQSHKCDVGKAVLVPQPVPWVHKRMPRVPQAQADEVVAAAGAPRAVYAGRKLGEGKRVQQGAAENYSLRVVTQQGGMDYEAAV